MRRPVGSTRRARYARLSARGAIISGMSDTHEPESEQNEAADDELARRENDAPAVEQATTPASEPPAAKPSK